MTPEERFQKIENALEALAEHHLKHSVEMEELRAMHKKHDGEIAELREMHTKLGLAIGVTNRQVGLMAEKVDALADSIDRFLKGIGPNGKH